MRIFHPLRPRRYFPLPTTPFPRRWISSTSPPGPLSGIRVLDLTRVLAGPYCTQILGDLGADVIKIEHSVRGDDTRAWGPPFAKYAAHSEKEGPGESAYFLSVNRNKRSVGLSFASPEGVEILHQLAQKTDVLVENYLPGTLKKYNLDYDTLHALNPSLIYASITGYGQTGPLSPLPGYDVMISAQFGLMHLTGTATGPPCKVGVAVTDLSTGLYASNAIMASLLGRARTGRGQHIDVALSDVQLATLTNVASSVLVSGERDEGRWGTAHPSIVPYRGFETADGGMVLIGAGNDRLFVALCAGLGKGEWAREKRFATNSRRVENRRVLEGLIEDVTRTKVTEEWLGVFKRLGIPCAKVNDVRDALGQEHVRARGMVHTVQHPECGPVEMVGPPVKYSESGTGIRSAPPTLGQHTDEVLMGMGMGETRIAELRDKGIIT